MKKTFTLNKNMLSMLGSTFYPTNHIMVVSNQENTLSELIDFIENNLPHNDYYVLPPEQIISVLGPTVVDNDTPLPSVGTEGANVRSYVKLAKEGHSALLVYIETNEDKNAVLEKLEQLSGYHARYYRTLVIEDLTPREHNETQAHNTEAMER